MRVRLYLEGGGFVDLPNVEKIVAEDDRAEITVYHPWSIYIMRPHDGHIFFTWYPGKAELSFFKWEEGGEKKVSVELPEFKVKGGDNGGTPWPA